MDKGSECACLAYLQIFLLHSKPHELTLKLRKSTLWHSHRRAAARVQDRFHMLLRLCVLCVAAREDGIICEFIPLYSRYVAYIRRVCFAAVPLLCRVNLIFKSKVHLDSNDNMV